jgi:hypothetical protein
MCESTRRRFRRPDALTSDVAVRSLVDASSCGAVSVLVISPLVRISNLFKRGGQVVPPRACSDQMRLAEGAVVERLTVPAAALEPHQLVAALPVADPARELDDEGQIASDTQEALRVVLSVVDLRPVRYRL